MNDNVEINIVEDFDNPPSKKAKCSESSATDDALPSSTISASLLPECDESIGQKPDNEINGESLPTPPTTSKLMLSPVSGFISEETVSADDDKKRFSADDDKQPNERKKKVNNVTYDYLPQGKIFI
jgi:hypothetical protein